MRGLSNHLSLPWICTRDLNEILFNHKKKGGQLPKVRGLEVFHKAIFDYGLQDAHLLGYKYN